MTFRAIVIDQKLEGSRITEHSARLRDVDDDVLMPGAVTIGVEYSGINYKDGLAIAGKPGIVGTSPLIPGIDLVGTVEHSHDPRFTAGDRVVLNGDGIGETHHGGLAERARVPGDSLVLVPDAISSQRAAAIGTAGFTAMLAVLALDRLGVKPDAASPGPDGRPEPGTDTGPDPGPESGTDILVTGSAGGVGSVAIALLAARGYRVTASSGRAASEGDYLRRLGASEVIDRAEFEQQGRPLQKHRWAGAVDSVGGVTLANVLAQVNYGGAVASCGLAGGADLPATVLPFILRAVTLTGINSVDAPLPLREQAWRALADELDGAVLDEMTTTIPLSGAIDAADDILAGRVRGRTVVDVRA
jgi:acrylyl-CoA reductase (NADPH)